MRTAQLFLKTTLCVLNIGVAPCQAYEPLQPARQVQQAQQTQQKLNVVVSIKPLHALVAGVMKGVDDPELLVAGQQSPHDFQFKPSQISQLHHAKIVFYIDDRYETFLVRGLESVPEGVKSVALGKSDGIALLPLRKGGAWETHEHHAEDGGDAHDGHVEEKNNEEHSDMHIWLNPQNAIAMTRAIADTLSEIYPAHQAIFMRNADAQIAAITAMDAEIATKLQGETGKPFVVFHDAYQYFERYYHLNGVGSITFEPSESPTPTRIQEVRNKIATSGAQCVFREPYAPQKLINTITENQSVRMESLDPEGTTLSPSASLYFTLMQNLAEGIKKCLREK